MRPVILFDLDGTLLNTPAAIKATFCKVLSELHYPTPSSNLIHKTIGVPLDLAFKQLLPRSAQQCEIDQCTVLYVRYFRSTIIPQARDLCYPEVEEGLKTLASLKYKCAVVTNKILSSAELILKESGLYNYFQTVIGSDCVKQKKPDPEAASLALTRLDAHGQLGYMIGDTIHDMQFAKNAKLLPIAVTYGVDSESELASFQPVAICDSFSEVISTICDSNLIRG